ncbi:MAG: hydrogen peroxide-inducible genes activator [Chitinophagales bacterium]|nr:hydrogen peroxide-inducible genes activator [Chitinophagales bacterium]
MDISLTQLEYAIALSNYLNFAKAAEACFVTQPTLSMQIKKLEETLGVVLFDRTKHPIVVTPIGESIINQSKIVIQELKKIERLIQSDKDKVEGQFSLAIIPTIAPYLLPYFVGSFIEKYPAVQLKITELKTDEIILALQKDEIDAGILSTPINEPNIIEEKLYYEEISVYAHIKHPLLEKKAINSKDISRNDIWLLSDGNCFRNQVINICNKKVPIQEHLLYESSSIETLKKMVEVEGGFTLLPELAVLEMNKHKMHLVRRFENPKPIREIGIVYSRSVLKKQVIDAIKAEIIDQVPIEMLENDNQKLVEWKF